MKRLALLVEGRRAADLISELGYLEAVEIRAPEAMTASPSCADLLRAENLSAQIADVRQIQEKLSSAVALAAPFRNHKKGMFEPYPTLSRTEFEALGEKLPLALELAERITEQKTRLLENEAERRALQEEITALLPWENLSVPLSFAGTQSCYAQLCALPSRGDPTELAAQLSGVGAVTCVSSSADFHYLFLLILKEHRAKAQAILSGLQVSYVSFSQPELCREVISQKKARITELEREYDARHEAWIETCRAPEVLEYAWDALEAKAQVLLLRERLLYSESCAFLQGYIREKDVEKLSRALSEFTVSYELYDIAEGEEPPVALENKPLFKPFESVIALYSYPAYRSFDPTVIMALFYFVLFGMMLADVVYGILMSVCCLLFLKIAKPRGALRDNMQLFAICGVSMVICGLLFGGVAGDLPSIFSQKMAGGEAIETALFVNPVTDPMTFLYLSVGVGAVHLLAGMGVKFYMLCREGHAWDAVCDVGMWYLVFIGLALFIFGLAEVGKWMIILGVAGLILTGGRREKNPIMKLLKGIMSLYDVINYASDLLSYSRVLALGLASAVIASVINTMATLFGPTPLGYILMTVILIFGHAVNILINLLGAYVHTGRLQYIEFFGKFYEDGGVAFEPARFAPKHFDLARGREKKS